MACLGPLLGSHQGMVKVSASAEVSMGKGSAFFVSFGRIQILQL